jgi:hypothetical protein
MKWFISFLMSNRCEVGGVSAFTLTDGKSVMAIAAEATFYTKALNVSKGTSFGIKTKALSAGGSPTIKIEVQQSDVLPATEGAADADYVSADGGADVYSNLNDEIWHVKQISLVPMTWCRLKITGLSGNPADATLEARLFQQSIM